MDKKISSIAIIILAVLVIFTIPFIPQELIDTYGLNLLLAPIALIIVVLVIIFLLVNKKTQVDVLQENRKKIVFELKEAEKQFLQHRLDKVTFDSLSKEKNAELIKVDAEIDSLKKVDLTKEELKIAQMVGSDKKKVLLGLLEQKHKKIHELKIAEQSYLKRKVDEESFKKISGDIKKETISIESQIKSILESEEIAKLKEELKAGAREIKRQIKSTQDRDLKSPTDEMEDDLLAQLK